MSFSAQVEQQPLNPFLIGTQCFSFRFELTLSFIYAYHILKAKRGLVMKNCFNLYFLSTIACQLSECLDEDELEILATELTTLGYMLESILARQTACKDD